MQRRERTRPPGSRPVRPARLSRLARPVRLGLLVAVLAALVVPVAACRHDHQLELQREFAACMREQGIDFPDPTPDAAGIAGPAGPFDDDWEAFEAARQVCEAETGYRMD